MNHPEQPIEVIHGVETYKMNAIIEYLALYCIEPREFNEIMRPTSGYSLEDKRQFLQLIGYTVDGIESLSYNGGSLDPEIYK